MVIAAPRLDDNGCWEAHRVYLLNMVANVFDVRDEANEAANLRVRKS